MGPNTTMLTRAVMSAEDLVKVTHSLRHSEDVPSYVVVRSGFLGKARPASMLLIVPELVVPDFLIEVEAYAATL